MSASEAPALVLSSLLLLLLMLQPPSLMLTSICQHKQAPSTCVCFIRVMPFRQQLAHQKGKSST